MKKRLIFLSVMTILWFAITEFLMLSSLTIAQQLCVLFFVVLPVFFVTEEISLKLISKRENL